MAANNVLKNILKKHTDELLSDREFVFRTTITSSCLILNALPLVGLIQKGLSLNKRRGSFITF